MTSTVGANKRKLTIAEDLQGAMKESNADGKDHFFQVLSLNTIHLKGFSE